MARDHRRWSALAGILLTSMLIAGFVPGTVTRQRSHASTPVAAQATPYAEAAPLASPSATPQPPSAIAPDGADRGTFAANGYGDLTAQGMHATLSYFFPVPLERHGAAGTLELHFTHSPLLVPELSTMTVVVNGASVTSAQLTPETAAGGQISVPIPESADANSSLAVQLSFYLRLTRERCEVPDNPALWVTVHEESRISFAARAAPAQPAISDVASLFARSARERENAGPVIVLPENPDAEELDAAGIAAYYLGRWLGQANQPALLSGVQSDLPGSDDPALLVGQGGSLSIGEGWGDLEWDGTRYLLAGVPVPADHGVLALRQQPIPQLLISGATAAAVRLAAGALASALADPLFNASAVVITGATPPAHPDTFAWNDGAASFAQLGVDRRDVTGPGEHYIDLAFDRPADWVLRGDSTLDLVLDVSPAVRLETSWVRVVINGLDIGAQRLRIDDGGNTRYQFALPAGRLNNRLNGLPLRSLSLQVRLFLDYPESECETIDPGSVWATLLPTSAWVLPHESADTHDISRFPSGLATGDSSGPLVALPDEASRTELLAALQVIAATGRWNAFAAPAPPVLRAAGAIAGEELGEHAVVVIGGSDRNTLAVNIEPDHLIPGLPAVVSDLSQPYGMLSLIESPWSDGKPALIIMGSADQGEGIDLAAAALADRDALAGMQGAQVVVTSGPASHPVGEAEPVNDAPREFAPYVAEDERPWIERIAAWQVISAILLVAFIALVVGVVIMRWIRGGSPKP